MAYKRTRQRLSSLFLGRQTDLNTPATSFGHALTGANLDYVVSEERDEYEDVTGLPTMSGRAFLPDTVRNLTNLTQAGRFDFAQILTPLVTGFGADVASNTNVNLGAVVSVPTGATNARLWAFEPNHEIGMPINYVTGAWTEQSADGSKAYKRAAKGFCTSLKIGRPETGMCMMESMYQFGKSKDVATAPTTLAIPNIIAVPVKIVGANIFDTYADAKAATLATLASNDICDFEFTLGSGHNITERMSNVEDLDYDDEDADDHAYMVSGSMFDDARATGLSASERGKKGDARFFRASLRSPKLVETIAVSGGADLLFHYQLDIVLSCIYTGESFEGRAQYDDKGRRKLSFEANGYGDQVSGKELYMALQVGAASYA